jgi:outer-membrane receptor for ferric coprogen and ferric-rhodotorulic acid
LLSLMVRYRITPSISVQFNGDNLLDEEYFVLDEYDDSYFGTPLSYSLSLNVRL